MSWHDSDSSRFRICGARCGKLPELSAVIDFESAIFIGTRDLVVHKRGSRVLRKGRLRLFAYLYRK